jgi:hypothetical protein
MDTAETSETQILKMKSKENHLTTDYADPTDEEHYFFLILPSALSVVHNSLKF